MKIICFIYCFGGEFFSLRSQSYWSVQWVNELTKSNEYIRSRSLFDWPKFTHISKLKLVLCPQHRRSWGGILVWAHPSVPPSVCPLRLLLVGKLQKTFYCMTGQDHTMNVNQYLSYYDSFKLSAMFRWWVLTFGLLFQVSDFQGLMSLLFFLYIKACVRNSCWTPQPVFFKLCRFSCCYMKMCTWIWIFDGVTGVML